MFFLKEKEEEKTLQDADCLYDSIDEGVLHSKCVRMKSSHAQHGLLQRLELAVLLQMILFFKVDFQFQIFCFIFKVRYLC